jgi:hypothetical protein
MMRIILAIVLCLLLWSCKNDKPSQLTPSADAEQDFLITEKVELEYDKTMIAKLDRLKIRTDSAMNAGTMIVVAERDSLLYMDAFSEQRENLKLRGKYYHEPWVKVKHLKSGKQGWVYGGAVRYASEEIKAIHDAASPLLQQAVADDLEWEGTIPTSWGTASITDSEQFKVFMIHFKEMVANNEIDKIADLIKYPLKDIKDKQMFKNNYQRLIPEELKETISEQRLDRIFRNSGGAMIGDGDIWFQQINGKYKIRSINFKGRADLAKDLMKQLSGNYLAVTDEGKFGLKAFRIKDFLELTINYQTASGFPDSRPIGKFVHETSHQGQHSFVESTTDSLRRQLTFRVGDSGTELSVYNDTQTNGLVFNKSQ